MNNIIYYTNFIQRKNIQGGGDMCTILEKIRNKTPIELLNEYHIPLEPPIDISRLLEKIGISTIAEDFSEIEDIQAIETGSILGAAFSNNNDLAIFYKQSDSLHRKKFTIAHELAHCCLDCPTNETSHIEYRLEIYDNLSKEDIEKEKRANIFAGELLIPEDILMKYYKKLLIPSLVSLAKVFDISTSVMAARLDYLHLAYYKDSVTEIIL